ncbi:MAG: PQQ-binding-like beta-propeller repeat protein [Verrucomicrobiota bacterium]
MRPIALSAFLSIACLLPAFSETKVWPEFMGPGGSGRSEATGIPTEFGPETNLKWSVDLPGRGWSSPVSDGVSLWLTAAVEVFPDEEERLRLLRESGEEEKKFKQRQVATGINLVVFEVELATGSLKRRLDFESIESPQTIHTQNSFASPTPVLFEELVIAHFGAFGTFAIDRQSGETVWERKIVIEHGVGPGSSPVVDDGILFLICDGVDAQFVEALDARTGETIWRTDRPEMRAPIGDRKKSYNTPVVITPTATGRKEVVCMGAQWLIAYDPKDGREIWSLDHGSGFSVVPRPAFSEANQLLYVATGFGQSELLAVKPGQGMLDPDSDLAWKETKRIPTRPSPLLVGEELFVISDGGVATCFDAATGAIHWTERVAGNYSGSPVAVGDRIFFSSMEGAVTVIKASPTFNPLVRNELGEMIMATPVPLDESLLIRTEAGLRCFSE